MKHKPHRSLIVIDTRYLVVGTVRLIDFQKGINYQFRQIRYNQL